MKLNNKGFAITAVLYGLLILFVVLVSSYLLVLGAKKDRIDDLVNDIESGYVNFSGDEEINLKTHITNLYKNSNPIEANGTIEGAYSEETYDITYYYSYLNTENTWGIMNDGLDDVGEKTGNINEGNIRYFGVNPNNYIYFNCSDYNNQSNTSCELWRIIGIVDGKVKIMRSNTIGNYNWNSNGTNDWNTATLKTLLNEGGSYYTGLKNKNSKTIEMIVSSIWYINKYDSSLISNSYPTELEVSTNFIYEKEREGSNVWNGDIALLYPSDYGYGVDLNKCKKTLNFAGDCSSYNWITNIITKNSSEYGWLLNPYKSENNRVWVVEIGGSIATMDGESVDEVNAVVPTLYLDTNLNINSIGDGTEGNPYQLIVN